MISRAVPRCNRRQAVTAQPHPVGSPVATGGGTVLTTMSQPMAQRCVHDPVPGSSLGRCPSRPGAIDPQNTAPFRRLALEGVWWTARAPRSCSVIPHTIPVRGAPVPQPRAVHTPASTAAISGASAVFRGFRPASLPTATTRDRRRLSLIATMRQEVLGVSGDPDVGQQRLQVHLLRREAGGGLVRKSEIRRSRSRREACRTGLTTVLADRVARCRSDRPKRRTVALCGWCRRTDCAKSSPWRCPNRVGGFSRRPARSVALDRRWCQVLNLRRLIGRHPLDSR